MFGVLSQTEFPVAPTRSKRLLSPPTASSTPQDVLPIASASLPDARSFGYGDQNTRTQSSVFKKLQAQLDAGLSPVPVVHARASRYIFHVALFINGLQFNI